MKRIAYHGVTGIELGEVFHYNASSEHSEFYTRKLTITMGDGSSEEIELFSDGGYALVSQDNEQKQLLRAA